MRWFWISFAVLFANLFQADAIQNRYHGPARFTNQRSYSPRQFRHVDTSTTVSFDWEHGLREATVQALLREHFGGGNIREHIYSAPLLGKEDKATPFGDIAILARGQLYANYAGFIYVQDPYQNDCDDCHNIEVDSARGRCINNHCQIWRPKNHEKLVALWTIKRIRHRSKHTSPKYEIEFTISPVALQHQTENYVTKEGTFNYNIPGHVFIFKSSETHRNSEKEQNIDHLKQGAYIAQTPDGQKYILHSFHGSIEPDKPRYFNAPPRYPTTSSASSTIQYSEEDEKQVYQTLLDLLHRKTSPESDRFTPIPKSSTAVSETTLVQFPDGQIVPITDLETPFVTKTTPGYVTVSFPDVSGIQTTPEQHKSTTTHTVLATSPSSVTPQSYGVMVPQTSATTQQLSSQGFQPSGFHTTLAEPHTTYNEIPQPPSIYTKPKVYPTQSTEKVTKTPQFYTVAQSPTTKPPYKMTFHYFAAEEEKKSTPDIFNKPLSTVQQEAFTEYENFGPDNLAPTEPTVNIVSASTTPSTVTNYSSTGFTKTSKKPYRPATVVKVTKPFIGTTKIYPSTYFTNKALSPSGTTIPVSKTTPSVDFEPSPTYSSSSQETQSTFKAPITVLEETTTGKTTEQEGRYPTTHFQQVYAVTQVPNTSYREPQPFTEERKFTTIQFVYPTATMTKLASVEEGTTAYQRPFTVEEGTTAYQRPFPVEDGTTAYQPPLTVEETEPSRKASGEFTTYTKIPTITSEEAHVKTTMGVTKFMGTTQNKATEMVYFAAEETEEPIKKTTQSATESMAIQTSRSFDETILPTLETKTEALTTPRHIVTTIKADGRVSVKTTPPSVEEELFGATKSSGKKFKTTKGFKMNTNTEPSDFLVDEGSSRDSKIPLYKKPLRDYSEDDIFGTTKSTTSKIPKTLIGAKQYNKSDIEQALFDTNKRRSKALLRRESSTTEAPAHVIYSNFFEASTIPMKIETTPLTTPSSVETLKASQIKLPGAKKSHRVTKRRRVGRITTESVPIATVVTEEHNNDNSVPVTSQSLLTSISYEINKRKKVVDDASKEKYPRKINIDRMDKVKDMSSSDESRKFTKITDKTYDNDFALRLASQAQVAKYLDEQMGITSASTVASTSARTTKKSKYMRRKTYVSKLKRPVRKKSERSREAT